MVVLVDGIVQSTVTVASGLMIFSPIKNRLHGSQWVVFTHDIEICQKDHRCH